jgi:dUTP pyrophosphatase
MNSINYQNLDQEKPLEVEFQLLTTNAKPPKRGSKGAACYDLYASSATLNSYYLEYDTGIAVKIPDGHVGLLYARSSCSNYGLSLANGVGVLDSDYRGPVKVRFYRNQAEYYEIGDRIAQLMILPLPYVRLTQVDKLSDSSERGVGGFGSTGAK